MTAGRCGAIGFPRYVFCSRLFELGPWAEPLNLPVSEPQMIQMASSSTSQCNCCKGLRDAGTSSIQLGSSGGFANKADE